MSTLLYISAWVFLIGSVLFIIAEVIKAFRRRK